MNRPKVLRLPMAPLMSCSGEPNQSALARRLGEHRTAICRAAREGLTLQFADHCAIALGMHPASIWGDAFYADIDTEACA